MKLKFFQHLTPVLIFMAALIPLLPDASFGETSEPSNESKTCGERLEISLAGVRCALRWIVPGSFSMGSCEDEPLRDAAEVRHEVEISTGFWLLETEVTQELYEAVTGENPSVFRGKNRPVDSVSWDDAAAFCERLNQTNAESGLFFCLPTEARWEYACRAGTEGMYAGDLDALAWRGEPSDSGSTHAVALKQPNRWGLYDMHGNLWEWCADGWSDYSTEKALDPFTIGSDSASAVRIDRGGCWDSPPQHCRSAWRGVYERNRKSAFVGFRIAADPKENGVSRSCSENK